MEELLSRTVGKVPTRDRLSQLAVSETGFIFDPQTGQSFSVNQTGLIVLDLLKRGSSLDAASNSLADRCGIPNEIASSSVEAFILQLGRYL
ncbi:MAG: PqqD family protein [Candidatus Obscuribacterales bacterium]|nr:PqqD family protein [Candidatus Obscuribacterales bacterium]